MKFHKNFQGPAKLFLLENEIDRMFVNSQVQKNGNPKMSLIPESEGFEPIADANYVPFR